MRDIEAMQVCGSRWYVAEAKVRPGMRTSIVELDHDQMITDGLRTSTNIERQLRTADIPLWRSRQ